MIAVSSKEYAVHQKKADMLGCDPANTYARRPISVLEGDAAWEFLERVKAMEHVPDPSFSEEKRKEWKEYFRKYELDKLKNGL